MHSLGKSEWLLRFMMLLAEIMAYAWVDFRSDSSPASQSNTTGVYEDVVSAAFQ